MRWIVAVVVLALPLGLSAVGFAETGEQTITPIVPPVEQRVDVLTPEVEQRVEAIDLADAQSVVDGTDRRRGVFGKATKAVVGVLAAAVSVGMMVVSLLLL